jgi:hypothetical protein
MALAEIARAEVAAKEGDGPEALHSLSRPRALTNAGQWVLAAATTIGTSVAATAIKLALGL